jgi:hypothetical protein
MSKEYMICKGMNHIEGNKSSPNNCTIYPTHDFCFPSSLTLRTIEFCDPKPPSLRRKSRQEKASVAVVAGGTARLNESSDMDEE